MRSFCLGMLLVALFVVSDGKSKHPKHETKLSDWHSMGMQKHGAHHPKVFHVRSDGQLNGHRPVGASPHSVYRDEWMKMSKYRKTKQSECKPMCHKHQICLADEMSGKAQCISRHNFREGRRLFRKFRNHDVKGLHKAIEDYSKHHQKASSKMGPHRPKALPHHAQRKDRQHKMLRKPHSRKHPMLKDFPGMHPKHRPQIPNNMHNMLENHRGNMKQNLHSPYMGHNKHHDNFQKPKTGPHKSVTIKHNHSGATKPHDAKITMRTKVLPSGTHGKIEAADEHNMHMANKALKKKTHMVKAVTNKMMSPSSHMTSKKHKPPMRMTPHKGHKGRPTPMRSTPHRGHMGQAAPMSDDHYNRGHWGHRGHDSHWGHGGHDNHWGHGGHHGHHGHGHHKRSSGLKMTMSPKHHSCGKSDLESMSKRLTGWFALLHATEEERLQYKIPIHKHDHKCDCPETAVWALHYMDKNSDNALNHTELKHLEANHNEPCLKPFLQSCDNNLNSVLSRKEWCCCFAKTQPPCLEKKQSLENRHLLGAFNPLCDETGYYQKQQCHGSTGYCWCVDLNGNEIPKSRAFGKAHCEKYDVMGHKTHQ